MMRSIIPQCNKQLFCDNEITVIIPSTSSSLKGRKNSDEKKDINPLVSLSENEIHSDAHQ